MEIRSSTTGFIKNILNNYYVYVYCDPRKKGTFKYIDEITGELFYFENEPFYVGLGKNNRWKDHIYNAKSSNNIFYNTYRCKKIRKIFYECNISPIIIKIKNQLTKDEAKRYEILLIKIIGRLDKGKGSLTNMTDGGEGNGRIVTESQRKENRERQLGEKSAWWGKKHTEETKLKISKGNKGKIVSNESKKLMSKSATGRLLSEISKQKVSKYNTGKNCKYDYFILNGINKGKNIIDVYTRKERDSMKSFFRKSKKEMIIYKGTSIIRILKNA